MEDLKSFLKHVEALKADAEAKQQQARSMIANLPEPQRKDVSDAFDKVLKQEMSMQDFIRHMSHIMKNT